ncbi:glycogen metabolism protein GlgX [Candidatus Symbiobacter mobilis CR]|uniref:Glycogen metabolism protein GlgX n=2 Tax=Candidatus Symbiobacter TaxID=1436289 RepID=U5N8A4_9BURK|nr:glycogen metabolism protein GlgX [Candidatus Symbiobacter mobilis CR]
MQYGRPWPLGATYDGQGVNFAVFSANALAIDVCIFDELGSRETARIRLPACTNDVWHGYLPHAKPGLVYGLRAYGPWRPDRGLRFDASKLLLDPYARDIIGDFIWGDEHFTPEASYPGHAKTRDNATIALKARVVHDTFDWKNDRPPRLSPADTLLYECHVRGFSKLQPLLPPELRGTFAGLGHQTSIDYFRRLGVTAISLMPVHYCLSEERLVNMGLSNYWGYNTIGFFCPNPRLCSGFGGLSPNDEFRTMVQNLHAARIEVILDVVYNHTSEAGDAGPTLSFRGLDNPSYYRLVPRQPSQYENYSGCGNTLNIQHPYTLRLVLDSLRYWVTTMHVDGFRFDLAPVLGRDDNGFTPNHAFFMAIAQDPVLCHVKMIAEPWDIGPNGYQVGNFPKSWHEWNDQFRDSMRRYWVQSASRFPVASGHRGEFAMRLCASSDLYQRHRRSPSHSINYVVSHDGFTLHDLVTYDQRHNHANGEDNRDGHGNNLSCNCGVEGPTDDPAVNRLRQRLQRSLLATMLLAQGTPMLCAGDEVGHTQNGNNNPYCQDNTTTWIDWFAMDHDLLAFTQRVIALRHQLQPFANAWYSGTSDANGIPDVAWMNANGTPLHHEDWHRHDMLALACLIRSPGRSIHPVLFLFNPTTGPIFFELPRGHWRCVLDTSHPQGTTTLPGPTDQPITVEAHSLMLLQQQPQRG